MLDWFDRGFSGTANAAQSRRHVRENEGRLARRTAISCWTLSGDSSLERWAIWNRVAGDVQIATTIGRLLDALDGPRLALGRVIYADHAVDWIRQNEDIVHLAYAKGTKFRAENEVRVALAPDPMLEAQEIPVSGGDVPFVSAGWIKGVRLHPDSSAVHADWLDRLLVSWQM